MACNFHGTLTWDQTGPTNVSIRCCWMWKASEENGLKFLLKADVRADRSTNVSNRCCGMWKASKENGLQYPLKADVRADRAHQRQHQVLLNVESQRREWFAISTEGWRESREVPPTSASGAATECGKRMAGNQHAVAHEHYSDVRTDRFHQRQHQVLPAKKTTTKKTTGATIRAQRMMNTGVKTDRFHQRQLQQLTEENLHSTDFLKKNSPSGWRTLTWY